MNINQSEREKTSGVVKPAVVKLNFITSKKVRSTWRGQVYHFEGLQSRDVFSVLKAEIQVAAVSLCNYF